MIKEAMTDVRGTLEIICADLDSWAEANEAPLHRTHCLRSGGGCGVADVQFRDDRKTERGHSYSQIYPCSRKKFCLCPQAHGGRPVSSRSSALSHKCRVRNLDSDTCSAAVRWSYPTALWSANSGIGWMTIAAHGRPWCQRSSRNSWIGRTRRPKAGRAAFQRIRFLRTSSAPLSPALHREFLDKFKLPLIQAMGSSEAGNVFSNPVPPGVNKIGSPGLPWGFDIKDHRSRRRGIAGGRGRRSSDPRQRDDAGLLQGSGANGDGAGR